MAYTARYQAPLRHAMRRFIRALSFLFYAAAVSRSAFRLARSRYTARRAADLLIEEPGVNIEANMPGEYRAARTNRAIFVVFAFTRRVVEMRLRR